MRRARRDPLGTALALNLAGVCLFGIASSATLLSVSKFGIHHRADLLTGPEGLEAHGLWELSVIVVFTTILAPALKLGSMSYVLLGLRGPSPARHLRRVFAWIERLRPWSMVEVYLLGVFVAYVRLSAIVQIEVGVALYALGALLLVMIAAEALLDHQAVWEEMERRGIPPMRVDHAAVAAVAIGGPAGRALSCHACDLLSVPDRRDIGRAPPRCPRCGSALHRRKPDAIGRTAALCLAAAILYFPANLYPVLTVVQFGQGAPSTILGGAKELLDSGDWPLALLVFLASVTVPLLKLFGLTFMLITTKRGTRGHLRDRTTLYRIIAAIGRWSMIDIFMASILVALVQFGALSTINANGGAIAFAAVVVLTMLAAETFDPRLMWDAAARRSARR